MLRFADNPPMTPAWGTGRSVFDRNDESEQALKWAAAYTKPRQEKALAFDLLGLEIDFFLPMIERSTVSGGRKRRNLKPLFASYVFFDDNDENRIRLMRTDRVVQVFVPSEAEQPRFAIELRAFEQALMVCPETLDLHPRIQTGLRARVVAGALKGTEGIIVSSDNSMKIWLEVTALGTGALVELPADFLEPLE